MEEATGVDSENANLVLTQKYEKIRLQDFCDEISFEIHGFNYMGFTSEVWHVYMREEWNTADVF